MFLADTGRKILSSIIVKAHKVELKTHMEHKNLSHDLFSL